MYVRDLIKVMCSFKVSVLFINQPIYGIDSQKWKYITVFTWSQMLFEYDRQYVSTMHTTKKFQVQIFVILVDIILEAPTNF